MDWHDAVRAWNERNGYIKFEGAGARKKQEQHPVKWEKNPPKSDFIKVGSGKFELKPREAAAAVAEERAPVAPASVMAMPEEDGEAGKPQVAAQTAAAAPAEDEDEFEDMTLLTYGGVRYWRGVKSNDVYEEEGGIGQFGDKPVGKWNPKLQKVERYDDDTETLAEGDYMPSVEADLDEEDGEAFIANSMTDFKKFVVPNMLGQPQKYWKSTAGMIYEYKKHPKFGYELGRFVGWWNGSKIDFSAPYPERNRYGESETFDEYMKRWKTVEERRPKLDKSFHINPRGYDEVHRIGVAPDTSHYLYFNEPRRGLYSRGNTQEPGGYEGNFVREATTTEYINYLEHLLAKVRKEAAAKSEAKAAAAGVAAADAAVARPRPELVARPTPGAMQVLTAQQKNKGKDVNKMRIQAFADGDIEMDEDLFTVFKLKGAEYYRTQRNEVWFKDGDKLGMWAGIYNPSTNSVQLKPEPTLEYSGIPTAKQTEIYEKSRNPPPAAAAKAELVAAPPVPSAAVMSAAGGGGGGGLIGRNMAARKIVSAPVSDGLDETLGIFTFDGKRFLYTGMNEVWEFEGGEMGKWIGKIVNDVMTKAKEPQFDEAL